MGKSSLPAERTRHSNLSTRDLAIFALDMLEAKKTGTYNVVAPAGQFSFGELPETGRQVSGADAHLTWVDDAFLKTQGPATGAAELPFWSPPEDDAWQRVSSD